VRAVHQIDQHIQSARDAPIAKSLDGHRLDSGIVVMQAGQQQLAGFNAAEVNQGFGCGEPPLIVTVL